MPRFCVNILAGRRNQPRAEEDKYLEKTTWKVKEELQGTLSISDVAIFVLCFKSLITFPFFTMIT